MIVDEFWNIFFDGASSDISVSLVISEFWYIRQCVRLEIWLSFCNWVVFGLVAVVLGALCFRLMIDSSGQ